MCAVPERITLPGINKKRKSGRGSPNSIMDLGGEEEKEDTQDFDAVYINLTKRMDRRKLIQGEMRAQGLKGKRFSARAGDDVKDSIVAREWHSKLNCLYDKKTLPALHKMSKGERGCSGSHAALWKQVARRDDSSRPLLILEDDAVLSDRSGTSFTEITNRCIAAVEQVRPPALLPCPRPGCLRPPRHLYRTVWISRPSQAASNSSAAPSHSLTPHPAPLNQVYDVTTEPLLLYVGCEVVQWRDSRRIIVEGPPVLKLREAEYLWQTSSYIIWPAAVRAHPPAPCNPKTRSCCPACDLRTAARVPPTRATTCLIALSFPPWQAKELLKHLPIDSPTDCYISKLVLEGKLTAIVASPAVAEQRDPYEKGDIKHTNKYK